MKNYRKIIILLVILVLIGGGIFYYFFRNQKRSEKEISQVKLDSLKTMELSSPSFKNNRLIPIKYTCDGKDVSPPLNISQVPKGTKSLVLIVDDPDAPMGTWDHWIVWNIEPSVSQIKEDEVPEGAIEGINDFKRTSYGGPCPPNGVHHYHFKLYALDKKLDINSSSRKKDLEKAMEGFIIGQTELVGIYEKR